MRTIRKEDFPELRWLGAALWEMCHFWRPAFIMAPEDARQTAVVAALLCREIPDEEVKKAFSVFRHEFRLFSKSLGLRLDSPNLVNEKSLTVDEDEQSLLDREQVPTLADVATRDKRVKGFCQIGFVEGTRLKAENPCGVPECGDTPANYIDEKFGRLCRRHYNIVNVRRRRGWEDPYIHLSVSSRKRKRQTCGVPGCGVESDSKDERYGRLCLRHANIRNKRRETGSDPYAGFEEAQEAFQRLVSFIPKVNQAFWAQVRLGVTDSEWVSMWLWALGETPAVSQEILSKARAVALGKA